MILLFCQIARKMAYLKALEVEVLWYMLNNADRYVYHYTRANTAIKHILKQRTLKLGQFRTVNDPRESIDWSFGYKSQNGSIGDTTNYSRVANAILKDNCNLCCFASDIPAAEVSATTENPLPAMYDRGHSRPRLWSQYSANHSGVCLVFDRRKLDDAFQKWAVGLGVKVFSGRVRYGSSQELDPLKAHSVFTLSYDLILQLGVERAVSLHLEKHFHSIFFTKHEDWSQEREFRWLLMSDKASDKYLPYLDSLVGVAIGEKFSNSNRVILGRMLFGTDVKIAEMCWTNGFPQLKPLHARPLSKGQNPVRLPSIA